MEKEFGKHYVVELVACHTEKIKFVKDVQEVMLRAAEKSRAVILEYHFHQFDPVGVSGFILIRESHFSIHTWPDSRYAALDIFTCGKMEPQLAIDEVKSSFEAGEVKIKTLPRGM